MEEKKMEVNPFYQKINSLIDELAELEKNAKSTVKRSINNLLSTKKRKSF